MIIKQRGLFEVHPTARQANGLSMVTVYVCNPRYTFQLAGGPLQSLAVAASCETDKASYWFGQGLFSTHHFPVDRNDVAYEGAVGR